MRICRWLFLGCLSLSSITSFANGTPSGLFMALGGGATWMGLANSASVPNGAPAPYNNDHYSIHTSTTSAFQYQLGYRWHREARYLPFINLYAQYMHFFKTTIDGTIEQYSLPEFKNYHYRLRNQSDLFTLTGKFDIIQYKCWLPYLSVGMGFIDNHLNDYNETPISASITPRTSPNYGGKQQSHFAATLGLGIDYMITDILWATLGYEHVFQGSLKTGGGNGSWSGTHLSLGNEKMNTVFLNISLNVLPANRG